MVQARKQSARRGAGRKSADEPARAQGRARAEPGRGSRPRAARAADRDVRGHDDTTPTKKPPATGARATDRDRTAPLPAAPPRPAARKSAPRPAFPSKQQPPSLAEFPARLPLAQGKRFEALRAFLLRQPGVSEGFYFYGPRTGWGLRYRRGTATLCSLLIQGDRLVGVLSVDRRIDRAIDWKALSPVARSMRQRALGSPSLLWLDLPLDGSGADDLEAIVTAKLAPAAGE